MGDKRRFDLFSSMIAHRVYRGAAIADVAGGKGYLQAALRQKGFTSVTTWDVAKRNIIRRGGYKHELFHYDKAPAEYSVVVAMHPDEATDHSVLYAVKHRLQCYICPCCVRPSAVPYWGKYSYQAWLEHLRRIGRDGNMDVFDTKLPMNGCSHVLVFQPKEIAQNAI